MFVDYFIDYQKELSPCRILGSMTYFDEGGEKVIKAKITKYSHFFKIEQIHPSIYPVMRQAIVDLLEVKVIKFRGKYHRENGKVFATRGMDKSEYRFHLNYLPQLLLNLRNMMVTEEELIIEEKPLYTPDKITLNMPEDFVPRDYQQEALDYIDDDGVSKLIQLPTGFGKTKTALASIAGRGERAFILVLGRYRQQWTEEIKENFGKDCDLCVVQGMDHLLREILEAKAGKPKHDVYLVSVTVMQRYIKEWELHQGRELEGMIPPEEIYETLGIGIRIIDEVHQHFHANFKIELYTHCPKCLYLTATLDARDKFMNFIYNLIWPQTIRMRQVKADPYDNTYAVMYRHNNPEYLIKRSNYKTGYSHIAYERAIMKNIYSRCQWLDMVGDQVENYFLSIYKPGRRCAIYASLVETCELLARYLNERFKDYNLKIGSFTASDSKEVIGSNDISCTTLGKAGTGLDIDGMVCVILTVALSEPKANKQVKGRNRNLTKRPGFEDVIPRFVYLVGDDIPKHRQYHKEKRGLFSKITMNHFEVQTAYNLGETWADYFRLVRESRWKAWGVEERKGAKLR